MLKTYFDVNPEGEIIATQKQDVTQLVRYCEQKKLSEDIHFRRKEEWKHYAEIPTIFVEQWMREAGITNFGKEAMELLFKKVNTEYSDFKVTNSMERFNG